jgi:nitric oxide reductase subunit C
MLSKSQARAFFLGGTLFFSLVFIILTIDTMRQIPVQTKSQNITPAVAAGKHIWETNNCMGCHTIFGEGAYYAPELTKVVSRRGATWIKLFMKDPQAMFPGERKMTKYNLSDQQLNDLVAFLAWAGEVDLNGFPADPPYKQASVVNVSGASQAAAAAQPEYFKNVCSACHAVNGIGGKIGPELDTAYQRYNAQQMTDWIKNPSAIKPGTTMPNLGLNDAQVAELVKYLQSFGGK